MIIEVNARIKIVPAHTVQTNLKVGDMDVTSKEGISVKELVKQLREEFRKGLGGY